MLTIICRIQISVANCPCVPFHHYLMFRSILGLLFYPLSFKYRRNYPVEIYLSIKLKVVNAEKMGKGQSVINDNVQRIMNI